MTKPTKEQYELLEELNSEDEIVWMLPPQVINVTGRTENMHYQGKAMRLKDLIKPYIEANTAVTEERVRGEERKRNSLIVVKAMVGVCSRTQPELSHKLNKIRLQILSNNQD